MTYTTTSGEPIKKIEGLKSAINTLQTNINNKYSVPPKYIESLQSIENTIKNIISKGYGSAAPTHEVATDEINIQE